MIHPSTQRVIDAARQLGFEPQVVVHEQSTRTAEEAAAAVGCHVSQIIKSLCFTVHDDPIMALVSGSNQLDERKLADHLNVGRKKIQRASAEQVKQATSYTIGGVAPFGHAVAMPIFFDETLLNHSQVWAAAGTPFAVFPIHPHTLAELTGATVLDLKK